MGCFSRLPTSDDIPKNLNPWGSQDDCYDDTAVLLIGLGKSCCVCQRVVLNCWLKKIDGKNYCPDHEPKGE